MTPRSRHAPTDLHGPVSSEMKLFLCRNVDLVCQFNLFCPQHLDKSLNEWFITSTREGEKGDSHHPVY
jgi:hypothetical protein